MPYGPVLFKLALINVTFVDTSPNYAINSFACFRPSIHKRLYGETRSMTQTMRHSTLRMTNPTVFTTLWWRKRMNKKRTSLPTKGLRCGISINLSFRVDLNYHMLEDELCASCQPTLAAQNGHKSKHLISKTTLRRNHAGFHDC